MTKPPMNFMTTKQEALPALPSKLSPRIKNLKVRKDLIKYKRVGSDIYLECLLRVTLDREVLSKFELSDLDALRSRLRALSYASGPTFKIDISYKGLEISEKSSRLLSGTEKKRVEELLAKQELREKEETKRKKEASDKAKALQKQRDLKTLQRLAARHGVTVSIKPGDLIDTSYPAEAVEARLSLKDALTKAKATASFVFSPPRIRRTVPKGLPTQTCLRNPGGLYVALYLYKLDLTKAKLLRIIEDLVDTKYKVVMFTHNRTLQMCIFLKG